MPHGVVPIQSPEALQCKNGGHKHTLLLWQTDRYTVDTGRAGLQTVRRIPTTDTALDNDAVSIVIKFALWVKIWKDLFWYLNHRVCLSCRFRQYSNNVPCLQKTVLNINLKLGKNELISKGLKIGLKFSKNKIVLRFGLSQQSQFCDLLKF